MPNYDKVKEQLLELGQFDLGALSDLFEMCRATDDHETNKRVRNLALKHIKRMGGSEAESIYNKTLLFDAPVDFDAFMLAIERNRPPEQQFWLPRRKKLMPICKALQDMEDNNLDELFLSQPPRTGKALADDTPILTRDGWKNHGDLQVGDEVIGMNGEFKKVIAVHPKCQLDVMVEFTNGEKIQCHENHEWKLYDHGAFRERLEETKYYESRKLESGPEGKRGHRYIFQLPKRGYVVGEEKDLPLDPYLLGVWLGDGANKNPRICNQESDKSIIERIERNGYAVRWKTQHSVTGVWYYDFDIRKQLQELGMCHSRKKKPKRIPEQYLTASIAQRLNLLAGLLDTDGTYVRKEHRYHFTTCEETLKDDFISLLATFGWRASVTEYAPVVSSSGVIGRSITYTIGFLPDCEIPCELERKQNHEFGKRRAISLKSIKRVEPKQGNCITVEGDGMYLAGRTMIPTHNTTLMVMFMLWVMGRDSEGSSLYCSFSSLPVGTFYDGLLEILKDQKTYAYNDVFPGKKLCGTDAKETTLDIDRRKRYHSFTGRAIRGSLNGSCDCNKYVIGDDLCEGIEEAQSKDRMASLWNLVDNNLITRAKEGAKRLWIGTRWSLIDPQGIRLELLRNEPKYASVRWKAINVPALDEQEESNFDYAYGVGFSSEYYQQRRASFERNNDLASWLAQYQGEPIERSGTVFDPSDIRTYNGVLPDGDPDRVFMVVDPAWGGGDFVAAPVVYQYGEDWYIPDLVYNNGDKTITQPMIVGMVERHKLTAMKIEGTKTTASYGEDIDKTLRAKGIAVNIQNNTSHFTGTGKHDRIIARAPDIREHMVFLKDGLRTKEYSMFMQNLYSCTFVQPSKSKHDDAPDVCAMIAEFVLGGSKQVSVFKRPW